MEGAAGMIGILYVSYTLTCIIIVVVFVAIVIIVISVPRLITISFILVSTPFFYCLEILKIESPIAGGRSGERDEKTKEFDRCSMMGIT